MEDTKEAVVAMRLRKVKLEKEISGLIEGFEEETGMRTESISLDHGGFNLQTKRNAVSVQVRVGI